MTPFQRYTHHCQEARVRAQLQDWETFPVNPHPLEPAQRYYLCCGSYWEDGCRCEAEPTRPETGCAECGYIDCDCDLYANWHDHDERTEDIESGKPLSNGSGFYAEEG